MKKNLSGIFLCLLIISSFTYVHADSKHITEFASVFYIPVLGTSLKVNMFRGIRILFNGFTMTFCLCIMMGSLFLFIKDHAPEFGLFSLICCLCILLYSSYPVIHTFLALPVQPVYTLETFGYYMMLPCMIYLEQRILLYEKKRFIAILFVAWAFIALFGELIIVYSTKSW